MDESETVVAQSSDVVEHMSANHCSNDYMDVNSSAMPAGSSADASYVAGHGSNSDAGTSHMDPSSAAQEASVVATSEGENRPPAPVEDANKDTVRGESTSVGLNEAATYVTNANGVGVSDANGNGTSAHDGLTMTAEQQFQDCVVTSAEEERLWSIVKANSLDFNAWTSLIEETEKMSQDNALKIREVYDAFLAEFPLCYGYWKKYADHEARFGAIDKVVEVYERAVQGVTYSVDIWLYYCGFAINTYADPDTIRRLFERALAYVGTDYLSYPLWDKYIEYEYTQQEWGRLAMIYTRILENPNQQLDRYFTSFKELSGSRPLTELKVAEEAAATAAADTGLDADGKENEKEAVVEAMDESSKPGTAGLSEAEELEKYMSIREEMYKKTKEFDSKISAFETAIRRPYFHVRPLNDIEPENWHNYLDFIERDGDFNKQGWSLLSYLRGLPVSTNGIFKLYERCVVACANYPEFWIRYILCMEASGSIDLAENALARATQVFVKRQPEIHLFAARFKEEHGDISGARVAYQCVHSEISPGLLEAIIDHANMERRLGNVEEAFSIYEQAIAIEKGKELSLTLHLLFAQYSRFVHLVCKNPEKARDILVGALEHVQLSKPLLEALIHLESTQSLPKQVQYIDSLVDMFITPVPDDSDDAVLHEKEELSSIYLEFLGLFGGVQSIKRAKDRHARLFLCHRSSSVSRKRYADDFLTSDKAKISKSYSAVSSTVSSMMVAYPTAQNQWTSGYGSQPQAWPQATQAQTQPYNTSYTQQAAYGGYYGTSYAPQQIAASAQAPAYGAYPSTYPVQAIPQQAYVAPVATATILPTQPAAAAVPQAFPNCYC